MYKVIRPLKLRVQGMVQMLNPGAILRMPEVEAEKLISLGKLEKVDNLAERMAIMGENCSPGETLPYVTEFNSLVIPFNSPLRYQYWRGGQSPAETLFELGRKDLINLYAGPDSEFRQRRDTSPLSPNEPFNGRF